MTEQTKTQTPDLASLLALVTQMPALQPLIWHNAQAVGTPEAPAIDPQALYWIRLQPTRLHDATIELAEASISLAEMSQGDPGPFPYNQPAWLVSNAGYDVDPIPHDQITHYARCLIPEKPTEAAAQPMTTDHVAEALAQIQAADRLVKILADAIRQRIDDLTGEVIDFDRGQRPQTGEILGAGGMLRDYEIRVKNTKTGAIYSVGWGSVMIDGLPVYLQD